MSQAVDQQINLYLLEIQDAVCASVATQENLINIWQNYNIYYKGWTLYVMYGGIRNPIGHIQMLIDTKQKKVCLDRIETKHEYRGYGIGQLLVTCCVLYAIYRGYKIRVGGNIVPEGEHFWRSLGLGEFDMPPRMVLDKILDKQRNLANKLNRTVDPQAILVQYNPVPH
ncbi:hypothetical protein [Bilophila wadsworthia]|jgi:GNAT superfamily N-acetyltransferase|uniref:hypothetical protein n=1 Tax=Bilophila wadsworthia TaxID=35833 RepID=UPI003520EF0D